MQINVQNAALYSWFERPMALIALVARMLLGAGLGIALILKVYMMVLTDWRCAPDVISLGNTIRCTPVIELVSGTLFLVVGFGFAAALFARRTGDLRELLVMSLVAVILRYISAVEYEGAGWQTALVVMALFAAFGGLLTAMRFLRDAPAGSTDPPGK